MRTTSLPPYRTFDACPKCGRDEPVIKWRAGARNPQCSHPQGYIEHFDVICPRCDYEWYEPVELIH